MHDHRVGVVTGHELEELHVTNRVEEVHDEEVLAERIAAALKHVGDAKPRRIRRNDGPLIEGALQLFEQAPLDVDVLDDRLDHEVAALEQLDVVLEVPDRDALRVIRMEERRRLRLERAFEAPGGELVPLFGVLLFFLAQPWGHDVEHHHVDPGVGKVRHDAAAHDARSDHTCSPYWFRHTSLLRFGRGNLPQDAPESKPLRRSSGLLDYW